MCATFCTHLVEMGVGGRVLLMGVTQIQAAIKHADANQDGAVRVLECSPQLVNFN